MTFTPLPLAVKLAAPPTAAGAGAGGGFKTRVLLELMAQEIEAVVLLRPSLTASVTL